MEPFRSAAARAWASEGRLTQGPDDPRVESESLARRAWAAVDGAPDGADVRLAPTGPEKTVDGTVGACRSCGAVGTLVLRSFQTRSADEASTLFEVCSSCGASRRAEDDC